METTFLTSIIGILIFSIIMFFGYKYANGKWKVQENKKEQYEFWVSNYGKKIKKGIIVISVLYGLSMLFQIFSILN